MFFGSNRPSTPPILYVNGANSGGESGTTNVITTGTFDVAAGNMVVCSVRFVGAETVTSVVDTGSTNSFSAIVTQTYVNDKLATWYAYNTVAKTGDAVTFNLSGNILYGKAACDQFSGVKTTSPVETSVSTENSGTSAVTPSFTSTVANSLLYSALMANSGGGSWTAGACGSGGNCTIGQAGTHASSLSTQYRIVSAIQTSQTMAASSSAGSHYNITGVVFKGQ